MELNDEEQIQRLIQMKQTETSRAEESAEHKRLRDEYRREMVTETFKILTGREMTTAEFIEYTDILDDDNVEHYNIKTYLRDKKIKEVEDDIN